MPIKYATQQQFQPPKVPGSWKPDEKRYAQQVEDLFRKLFSRFGRLRFEDLGDGVRLRINGLADDYSELELRLQGFAAAVNGNRLDFSAAGLQVINSEGEKVFRQETDTGNLTITGTIYAEGGSVGGFTIDGTDLRADGILISASDGRITVRDVTITEPEYTGLPANVRIMSDGTLAVVSDAPKIMRGTVSIIAGAPVTLDFSGMGFEKTPVVVCSYASEGDGGVLTVTNKSATSATINGTNETAQSVDYIVMEG